MHSASLDSATSQTSAQLQQQQTEQQRTRQQSHPQQQQYFNHMKAIQQDPELRRKALVNRLLYRSRQRGFLEMDLLVGIWAEKQIPQLSENMLQQFEIVLDQENPDLYKWLTGQEQPPQDVVENAAYQVYNRHLLSSLFLYVAMPSFDDAIGLLSHSSLLQVWAIVERSAAHCQVMQTFSVCVWLNSCLWCCIHRQGFACVQALFKDVSLQLQDHVDQTARAPEGKEWVRGWDDWNKASETAVKPGPLADK